MIALAFRNLFRHRGRTATTVLAIGLGVAGLILAGGFVHDIFAQLGEAVIHSQTGHVQLLPRPRQASVGASADGHQLRDPEAIMRTANGTTGVESVMARVAFPGLVNNGRNDWAILGEGVEPDKEAALGTYLRVVSGRLLRDTDRASAMIGEGVANALNLSTGDIATLVVNTVDGALNTSEVRIVGIFQSFSKDFDDRAVRIPLADAQELLASKSVNAIVVALKRTDDTQRAAADLRRAFSQRGIDVKTWRELNDFYQKTVDLYDRQFGVLHLIVLAMVVLTAANTINMGVFERLGEFGTMRALGNRRRTIAGLIVTESLLLGIVGSLVGALLGIALALAISAFGIPMPPPPNANLGYEATIRIVPSIVTGALLVGFLATGIAALVPSLRASRLPIVDALRTNV